MSWFWRAEAAGAELPGLAETGFADAFGSQSEAEAWLTSNYPELAELGVRTVALYEEQRIVYGPMSLEPE
jgi:hypothetical protein